MANEEKLIRVTLKYNQDTGALEIANQKMKGVEDAANKASAGSDKLLGSMQALMPAMTAIAAIKFLENAVKESEQSVRNIQQLQGVLHALGISWDQNAAKVGNWAKSIQANTTFADDVAISSLKDMVAITGDLQQAMNLTKLAMDISITTGKNYNDIFNKLGLVYQNNERGLTGVRKEFKGMFSEMDDGQKIIDKFFTAFDGGSEKEKNITATFTKIKNDLNDMTKEIGVATSSWLEGVVGVLSPMKNTFKSFFITIMTDLKLVMEPIGGIAKVAVALFKGQFKEIPGIIKATKDEEIRIYNEGDARIKELWTAKTQNVKDEKKKESGIIAGESEAQKEKQIADDKERAEISAKISQQDVAAQMKAIDAKAAYFKSKGVDGVAVEKWVANEKAKIILEAFKQYIDIEGDTSKIIDTLATGSAEQRKYLIADLLEAETLANSKRLAMFAFSELIQGHFAQAALAAAESAALGIAATAIHADTEANKAKDKAASDAAQKAEEDAKKAVEDAKKSEEDKANLREDFAKTTLEGQLANIDKQAQAYKDAGSDAAKVDTWAAEQKAAANKAAAEKAKEATTEISASATDNSVTESVTRSEQIIRIDLGGIEINIATLNTTEADIDKLMRNIGNEVQARSLEGIQMAMKIYKAGLDKSDYSV